MARRRGGFWPGLSGPAALVLALSVAAACAAPQANRERPRPKAVVIEVPVEQPLEPAREKPAAPERAMDPPPASEPAPAPEPAPQIVRRVINDDPAQLMGLAPDAIGRLLGQPSLLRSEPPAQVWQYAIADCVLDIFLYAEESDPKTARVTYFEIRGGDAAARGMRACFAAILESRPVENGTSPHS